MKLPFLSKTIRSAATQSAQGQAPTQTPSATQDGAKEALQATKLCNAKAQSNKQLLSCLRNGLSFYSRYLPDHVRIPAMGPARPDDVLRSLPDATVDDLAFAIQASDAEHTHVIRRTGALKELYEAARQRGALGSATVADVFASKVKEAIDSAEKEACK